MTLVDSERRHAYDSDVLLSDGRVAKVRSPGSSDRDNVVALLERVSDETRYLRFFTAAPARSVEYADRILRTPGPEHAALVAVVDGRLVAVAEYERTRADRAEVAVLVDDAWHGDGIGTLLIEHLAAIARADGIERFEAAVLPTNSKMHAVFTGLGFALGHEQTDGVVTYEFPLALTDEFIEAALARELVSDVRSLEHILRPRSVAVIGASRRRGTVGGELFRNLLRADFAGSVFPVNPSADAIAGVRAYPAVTDIPSDIDLAVITVPAAQVLAAVEECGRKGVGGVVVISAGFREAGGTDAERELVQIARRHGMRLVGPNCMGVVNTDDEIRMDATFAPVLPVAGRLGFLSQSGALGIAVLEMANEHGLGVSTFVSVGNKADVSGNDLLAYWEQDPNTDVIALYLESFGNPRKFARLARRVARVKPIVAMKSGRSQAGARAGQSHTASAATPDVAVDALFRQAGIVRVDTMEELFDVTAVLIGQPLPRGRRLAVVGNSGGPGVLAADAADAAGLEMPEFSAALLEQLRTAAPGAASLQNPVDLGAGATADQFGRCLDVLAQTDEIDCVLTIFTPPLVTKLEDVEDAIVTSALTYGDRPIVANLLVPDGVRKLLPIPGTSRQLPTFMFPEAAVRALARSADYADWQQRDHGTVPAFSDIDVEGARAIVSEELQRAPDGHWLSGARALELVAAYGVPTVAARHVTSADDAVKAASDVGFPVVLKAASGDLVHKTEEGGVVVGLASAAEVRSAYDEMAKHLGERMGGGLIEPMARGDLELIVGVAQQESFGPVVMFGLGGVISDVIRDRAFRLVPMTDADAHELVRSLRGSPLLFGYRGSAAIDVAAVEELLLRVGRLADDIPEIAELDLNPVLASETGVITVDAKVRLAPVAHYTDPLMRRLR